MCAYACACAALIPSPLEVAKAPWQDHVNANPETRDDGMRVAGVHLPSRLVLGEVDVQKLAVGDAGGVENICCVKNSTGDINVFSKKNQWSS